MISVCMTTFNGEKYLKEQLESILFQLNETDELLISDDGSTDSTLKIIETYKKEDARISVLKGPRKGVIKNVEFVLGLAKGDYIFLSDQDDIWMPDKIVKMVEIFSKYPNIQLVLSDLTIINQSNEVVANSYFSLRNVRLGMWKNILRSGYIGAGMAFTAELKEKSLPFPEDIPMHDMWLGILAGKNVYLLREKLTYYRRHEDNVSEIKTTSSLLQKMKWRMSLLKALFTR